LKGFSSAKSADEHSCRSPQGEEFAGAAGELAGLAVILGDADMDEGVDDAGPGCDDRAMGEGAARSSLN
jgi:hypothetical protein